MRREIDYVVYALFALSLLTFVFSVFVVKDATTAVVSFVMSIVFGVICAADEWYHALRLRKVAR